MSALVTGCFAPDLPYLLSLSPRTVYGHTVEGMFLLDLPLALLTLWLFHAFLKVPMLVFLPDCFRRRLTTSVSSFSFWPPARFLLIIISILVGTATHLVWDAFTHNRTWIYQNWGFLRKSIELPMTGQMQMCKFLEYGSSVIGLAVVAVWIWHWYRTTRPSASPVAHRFNEVQRRTFVAGLPALAILGGVIRAAHAHVLHRAIRSVVHFTGDILISSITFFLLGMLVCGIIERLLPRHAS